MAILTNAKIKEACEFVVAASGKYQRLQWIAYNTMLRTGCREGEIVDLWRWRLTNVGTYVMKTEKSGADRTFEAVNLPIEYREWISERTTGIAPTSTDRLRSAFRQMVPYGNLTVGNKGISTHLFRYNYIRQLKEAGYGIPELKVIMGLTSTKVVTGYLGNPVEWS